MGHDLGEGKSKKEESITLRETLKKSLQRKEANIRKDTQNANSKRKKFKQTLDENERIWKGLNDFLQWKMLQK